MKTYYVKFRYRLPHKSPRLRRARTGECIITVGVEGDIPELKNICQLKDILKESVDFKYKDDEFASDIVIGQLLSITML